MRTGSEVRFWQKVGLCKHVTMRVGEHYQACETCCWPWQGSRDAGGYGLARYIVLYGEETRATRVAWAFAHHGMNPPKDREVAQTCDHPPCNNPSHLWLATPQENSADRSAKGRNPHIAKKLGWAKAARIRELGRARLTQREIAAVMGCSQVMVCQVLKGRSWPDTLLPPIS